jgi:hypothetical protein
MRKESPSVDCGIVSCELDTHADTCCFGKGALILSVDQYSSAEVTGFSTKLGKVQNVPIVSVAVAYDCPNSYHTYILTFHQSLYIKELTSHLICPNQLRMAGVTVNDCPLQFIPPSKRTPDSHTIQTKELTIQLRLRGVISYFNTRQPTEKELYDTVNCTHIEMTAPYTWDPYDDKIGADEHQLTFTGDEYSLTRESRSISSITSNMCSISRSFDTDEFVSMCNTKVIVGVTKTLRKGTVTAQELAEKWFIGLNSAQRTIEQSTQRGVRDFSISGGQKRMKHTAHQLMYRHIRSAVYTDTMFNKVKSLQQNNCAQVYITSFHWTRIYPMRTKAEAHLTLDLLHKDVGVFHTIIPDNALELTEGEFRKKAIHAGS